MTSTATLTLESIVARDDEPVAARVDDEVVMLSARAQSYFGLGDVGSQIWTMLEDPRRVADICGELMNSHDVDPASCERDVLAFLTELLEQRLIRIVDAPEPRP